MAFRGTVKKSLKRGRKPLSQNSVTSNMPVSGKRIRNSLIRRGIHPSIVDAVTNLKEKTNDGN